MNQKKILLAEDDQFILKSFAFAIRESGYHVDTVSDGSDVLRKIEEYKPDALILDLILPKKNGFDILKEIRTMPEHKDLPIIVATSLGMEEDKEKVMSLGATDFIIKPHTTSHDLLKKIHTVFV